MTRHEYETARDFMASLGVTCPAAIDLQRGGIIGSVDMVDVVDHSDSPWFFGPRGLVLKDPESCEFIPCAGALGFFRWVYGKPEDVPPAARWMKPVPPPGGLL
jgi:hypothetical protein